MQNQPAPTFNINELSIAEVSLIAQALANMPYGQVAQLVGKIHGQIQQQEQAMQVAQNVKV